MAVFEWRSTLPVTADEAYAWHARRGAFARLAPPWQKLRVVEDPGGINDGDVLVFEYGPGPFHGHWVAVHEGNEVGRRFTDRQVHGPFAEWEHTHSFIPAGSGASLLEDHIDYLLPLGGVADALGAGPTRHALERLFRFRHRRTRSDLLRHAAYTDNPRLRVGVTGATGLIGSHLASFLSTGGHEVARFVRDQPTQPGDIVWDPGWGKLSAASLDGLDAIVHLGAESLNGRWNDGKKRRILDSRVSGTALVARTVAGMKRPPKTLVCVSAIGFYGDRGDEELNEDSSTGDGFLAEVARQWEEAAAPAREAGVRVVSLRLGIVLSGSGGALASMLPAFRAGVGGPIAGGKQWWSWIALDDVLGAILAALCDEGLGGPVNVVSPHPVTNKQFTKTLGRVLRRPTVLPLPGAAIEQLFGEMGQQVLLSGQRVRPDRLQERDFAFQFGDLEDALRFELGKLKA